MDEYCRKLAFKSQSIQKQVIFKLYNDTLRKMQGKLIDGKQPEPGELKLLLEHTGSDDQTVAKGCCVAIVTMVKQARADIGYVLKNLLNQVSSARSLIGLVEGICELLSLQVLQSKADGQKYTCPFKIRTPPHPLVTLMINRPEEWPAVVQALTYLCCHNNNVIQEEAIELLSPFLKYILLDPEHHQHIQPIRSFVQRYLVHLIRATANPILRLSALKFICECVPCAQMKTRDQVQELSLFVTDVTNTCCSLDDNELSFIKNSLQKINLGVCKHLLNHGLNTQPLTSALVAMVHNYLELMKVDDAVFIHLTSLLMKCPMEEAENLLLLCKVLMEKGGSIVAKATLVLPLLQILSASRNILSCPRTVSVQALAEEVMFLIQTHTPTNSVKKSHGSRASLDPSEGQSYAHLTLSFSHNASAAAHWLKNLTYCIPHMATVPTTLSSIVAALLTLKMGSEVTILALQVIAAVTKKDSKQAPSFLCLMLYQLKLETHPQVVKEILRTIPLLAVDKMNVAPVLRTVLSFKSCAAMRPQYISMLSSLWQLQDRCFPHLLEAISDTGIQVYDKVTGVDEVKLAQAKAIREICRLRPEQHGSDMLGPISSLLEENPEERDTPIAALVLEGLYFLCEAEVVSIMSVWSVLKEKLVHDTRPLVIMRMCQLFSLVPALHVETPEYESFTAECVLSLWLFTGLDEPKVRGAALRALAAYNPTFFKLSHFPTQVVQEFEAKLHAVNKDKDQEAETTLDELFPSFPADVYIKLMRTMPAESLPDYKVFLSAMIKNEVKNIPCGVHYNSIQKSVSTNQKKVVEGIPAFIELQYNQLKLPAVRPGLAAGLLFTFNPSMEVGRDGRPKKHSIIGLSKKYKEMFLTLLQEVPVQPSEWHRSVLLPQAWLSFVDRLYTALIEARKAEVDLQLAKQHLDQEDAEERKLTSWLWARDAISDAIKTSSRGSPTVQSNCVYALGALTATVASHVASMDKKEVQESEESTEYRTHSYWSMVAIDTLMSIMNIKHMPKGKILGLCQQKSVEDRLPASVLAQGSACVALSLVVPCLISTNISKLHDIMHFLTSLLPGKPGTDETPLLSFHAALGLGLFLAKFLEENVANMAEEKVFEDTQQCFKELESSCFDESQDNRTGPLLGLAVTCQAICVDRQMESQTDMNCLLQRLIAMFKSVKEGDMNIQPLSVCIACAAGAGFAANLVSMEMATDVVTLLSTFCNDHPENAGVALSLGMLIHALHQAGHPGVNQKRKDIYAGWLSTIESKAIPSVHKLAALNGVLSVTGAENSLIPVTSSDTDSEQDLNVKDVVKTMCHLVTNGNDLSLQRNCAWLLGRLYFSLISQTESRSSVPSTYGYLPEESFLRACADFLLDAGRQGAKEVSPAEVEVTLKCLADVKQALPPVNFSAILTPLMQPTFGEIVQTLCLLLAVNQCGAMPTVAFFLSRWMVPPLLSSLCSSSLELLYRSLAVLSKSVSPGALKSFLEHALKPPFVQWDGPPVEGLLATLEGLSDALKIRDPSAPVKNILQNAIEDFYKTPDIGIKKASYLCAIGECLSHLPFEILDTLISEDFFHEQRFYLGTFVRCYLVARGRQPVAMLNSCIDSFLCNSLWDEAETLCLLLHGFQQITLSETAHASTISRQKWFVELLGHTRNLLTGAVTLGEDVDKQRLSRIAVYLVGAILFLWTTPSTAALFDLQPMMFQTGGHRQEMTFGPQASLFLPFATIEDNLTEPWDQLVPKIIDWMLTVLSVKGLDEELQNQLKVNLVCLKHQQEMKKPQVWARVFDQL